MLFGLKKLKVDFLILYHRFSFLNFEFFFFLTIFNEETFSLKSGLQKGPLFSEKVSSLKIVL